MVASYFKIISQPAAAITTIKFKELDSEYLYENLEIGGDELLNVRITLPRVKQNFLSMLLRFKIV